MSRFLHLARTNPARLAQLIIGVLILLEVLILVAGPSASEAKREIAEALAKDDNTSHWEPEADIGIHYAAVINLGLLALLAITAKVWTRPFSAPLEDDPLIREKPPLWQRLVLPITMVVGFASIYGMTSFASKGLWWDEMWALKQAVHGSWKPDKKKPDQLKFQPTTWKRCAFYYQKPTNHAPMSLAQKASLSVWRTITGAEQQEFNELAVRMPALIASGLAALLLMRLCGLAQGAALGALLLLVHPWHLRYGVDARAYAFVVPLCISALLAARKIIFQRGRRPWPWIWLGMNQALWVWAHLYGALDALVIFAMLAVFLWRGEETLRDKGTAMLRLVITHVCAALVFIQVFLPNLMQARHWAGQESQGHQLDALILKDTLSSIALGMSWLGASGTANTGGYLTGLVPVMGSEPAAYAALAFMLGLSLLGLRWAVRHQPRTGWLLTTPIISAVLLAVISILTHQYYYPRFAIALLPVFVAGISLSGQLFSVWSQVQRRIVLGIMVVFVLLTNYQRGVLMVRPYAGFKGAAEFVSHWPANPKPPLVAGFGHGREVFPVYYPQADEVVTIADIQAMRTRAKAEGRDLLIVQGHTQFNLNMLPTEMKLLLDPMQFEELAAFPGIEPDFLFRVLKAK